MNTQALTGICFCAELCQKLMANCGTKLKTVTAFTGPVAVEQPVALLAQCIGHSSFGAYASVADHSQLSHSTVGRYSAIGSRVVMGLSEVVSQRVSISNAFFGHSVFDDYTHLQDHHPSDYDESNPQRIAPVTIGHDVWVGTQVCIPAEVTIGTGAIIGAGAVITKDVEPYAIVVGHNRQIRSRFSDEICADLLASAWWRYDIPRMLEAGLDIPLADPQAFLQYLKDIDSSLLQVLPDQHYVITPQDATSCALNVMEGAAV